MMLPKIRAKHTKLMIRKIETPRCMIVAAAQSSLFAGAVEAAAAARIRRKLRPQLRARKNRPSQFLSRKKKRVLRKRKRPMIRRESLTRDRAKLAQAALATKAGDMIAGPMIADPMIADP